MASTDGAIDVERISTDNERNIASEVNKAMEAECHAFKGRRKGKRRTSVYRCLKGYKKDRT